MSIVDKIYLCNFDGNNECFKKIISSNNNFFSLDFFNNIKKISLVNSNNNKQYQLLKIAQKYRYILKLLMYFCLSLNSLWF